MCAKTIGGSYSVPCPIILPYSIETGSQSGTWQVSTWPCLKEITWIWGSLASSKPRSSLYPTPSTRINKLTGNHDWLLMDCRDLNSEPRASRRITYPLIHPPRPSLLFFPLQSLDNSTQPMWHRWLSLLSLSLPVYHVRQICLTICSVRELVWQRSCGSRWTS